MAKRTIQSIRVLNVKINIPLLRKRNKSQKYVFIAISNIGVR